MKEVLGPVIAVHPDAAEMPAAGSYKPSRTKGMWRISVGTPWFANLLQQLLQKMLHGVIRKAQISALHRKWSGREDSNLRPLPPEDSALPG